MAPPNWFERLQRFPVALVGEFLGTRGMKDSQARAARRWLRRLFKMDAEQLALCDLLVAKGIFTKDEYEAAIQRASQTIVKELEREFPGLHASESGVQMDLATFRNTAKDWPA